MIIRYISITFFNSGNEIVGRFRGTSEVNDERLKEMLKEHNASYATIENQARMTKELNIKIA